MKTKISKRLLAILLALIMILSSMYSGFAAFALDSDDAAKSGEVTVNFVVSPPRGAEGDGWKLSRTETEGEKVTLPNAQEMGLPDNLLLGGWYLDKERTQSTLDYPAIASEGATFYAVAVDPETEYETMPLADSLLIAVVTTAVIPTNLKAGDKITFKIGIRNSSTYDSEAGRLGLYETHFRVKIGNDVTIEAGSTRTDREFILYDQGFGQNSGGSNGASLPNSKDILAPGDTLWIDGATYSYEVSQDEIDRIERGELVQVEAATVNATRANASDGKVPSSGYFNVGSTNYLSFRKPLANFEKKLTNQGTGKDADKNPAFKAGETAYFDIIVTSLGADFIPEGWYGDVTVEEQEGVTILPGNGYSVDGNIAKLNQIKANGSVTIHAKYEITEKDVEAGEFKNVATLTHPANEYGFLMSSYGAEVDVPIAVSAPSLNVEKKVTNAGSGTGENGAFQTGDTVNFEIVVNNDGSEDQNNVTVQELLEGVELKAGEGYTLSGQTATIDSLPTDKTVTINATYTVKETDLKETAGTKTNTVTVTGDFGDGSEPKNFTANFDLAARKAAYTVDKALTTEGEKFSAGTDLTYTITVKNTGNVTQHDIQITEALPGATFEAGANYSLSSENTVATISELAPGATVTITAKYTVKQTDIDNAGFTNKVTVSGGEGGPGEASSVETKTEDRDPSYTVTKVLKTPGSKFEAGTELEYLITVKNTGNTTQKNIQITEALPGATFEAGANYSLSSENTVATISELAPGATVTITAKYTVKQTDVDNAGFTNKVSVSGGDNGPDGPISAEKTETEDHDPKLTITKALTNGDNAPFSVGDTAEFTITVKNEGNVTLTNVKVTDDLPGALIQNGTGYNVEENEAVIASLAPDQTVEVTVYYTITQADVDAQNGDKLVNTASVKGNSPGHTDDDVTAEIPEESGTEFELEERNPGLTINKELAADSQGTGVDGKYKVGDTAKFTITVYNSGNTTQRNIVITEALPGATFEIGTGYSLNGDNTMATISEMEPGATVTITAKYTIKQKDIDSTDALVNSLAVSGAGENVNKDEASATIDKEEKNPYLNVEKTVTKIVKKSDGSEITSDFGSYKVNLGDVITYTITVTNTGNITMSNMTVEDSLLGINTDDLPDTVTYSNGIFTIKKALAPDEGITFSYTYTVLERNIGKIIRNTAVVKGEDPSGNQQGGDNEFTQTNDVQTAEKNEKLTVVKALIGAPANGEAYALGEKITYRLTISNTGNQTLKNATVTDSMADIEAVGALPEGVTLENGVFTIAEFGPNDPDIVIEYTHVVNENDILNGSVENYAVTSTMSDDEKKAAEDDPVTTDKVDEPSASMTINKAITNRPKDTAKGYEVGEEIEYTITIRNTGNVTLTNVTVDDSMPYDENLNVTSDGVTGASNGTGTRFTVTNGIGPGKDFAIVYTHKVTQEEANKGKVENSATAKGSAPDDSGITGDVPATNDPVDGGKVTTDDIKQERKITYKKTMTNGDEAPFDLGKTAKFDIVVKNEGNVTQNKIEVIEGLAGAVIVEDTENPGAYTIKDGKAVITDLAPGASVTVKAEYTITLEDMNAQATLTNTVSIEGDKDTDNDGRDEDTDVKPANPDEPAVTIPMEDQKPYLTVVKRASCPEGKEKVDFGDVITFTLVVKNEGNATLKDATVSDTLSGIVVGNMPDGVKYEDGTFKIDSLDPGDSKTITYTYTITADDILKGGVTNRAFTSTGGDNRPEGEDDHSNDTVIVPTIDPIRTLKYTKTLTNAAEYPDGFAKGNVAKFEIVVENTGNVVQKRIEVAEMEGAIITDGDGYDIEDGIAVIRDLQPNTSVTVYATYELTQEDIDNGGVTNVVTVTGDNGTKDDPDQGDLGEAEIPTVDFDQKFTVSKVAKLPEGKTDKVDLNDVITYTITVKNDGNVTMSGITVEDSMPDIDTSDLPEGVTYADGTFTIEKALAPQEEISFSYTYTVLERDIGKPISNTAVAKGVDPNGDPQGGDDEFEKTEIVKTEDKKEELTINKELIGAPANGEAYALGEKITYKITISNTGNQTLKNATVTDSMADIEAVGALPEGVTLENGVFTIAEFGPNDPDIVIEYTHVVNENDILNGSVENYAVTSTMSDDEKKAAEDDPVTTDKVDEPSASMTISKRLVSTAPVGGFDKGDAVEYTIVVVNNGNVTLSDVTVDDTLPYTDGENALIKVTKGAVTASGDENGTVFTLENPLEPGEILIFVYEYTVTQKNIDEGKIVNGATATGSAPEDVTNGVDPDDDKVHSEPETPGADEVTTEPEDIKQVREITYKKELTNNGSGKNGAFLVNETAEFDITVTNSGNVTQQEITVEDALDGAEIVENDAYEIVDGKAVIKDLAPGEQVVVKAIYTLTQTDIDNGGLKNTVAIEGDKDEDNDNIDEGTEVKPETKPGEGGDPDVGGDPDDNLGEAPIPTEEPERLISYKKELTNAGSGENGAFKVGETAEFDITVTNRGNVTQEKITVDEMPGAAIVDGEGYDVVDGVAVIKELAPGKSVVVKAIYLITQDDIDNGGVTNVVDVVGDPKGNGTTVEKEQNDDPEAEPGQAPIPTETRTPAYEANKKAVDVPEGGYEAGETAKFVIEVKNTGNMTLEDLVITEQLEGAYFTESPDDTYKIDSGDYTKATITKIEVGDTVYVYAEYVVTQEDVDAGKALINNVGITHNNSMDPDDDGYRPSPEPGVSSDAPISPVARNPKLHTEKRISNAGKGSGANGSFKVGDTVEFEIKVVNDGNVTQKNVKLTEKLDGAVFVEGDGYTINSDGTVTIPRVKVGEYVIVYAEYTVRQSDLDNSAPFANSVATEGENTDENGNPSPVPDVSSENIPEEEQAPALTVSSEVTSEPANGESFELDEKISSSVTVTNDGNVTLTDIDVVDPVTGEVWHIDELKPGESYTFETNHTVTEEDIENAKETGEITNSFEASASYGEETVKAEGSNTAPVEQPNPSMTVTSEVTGEPANGESFELGEELSSSVTVTNDGNVTLTDIDVVDPVTGEVWHIDELKPGESYTFETSRNVTEEDIENAKETGEITNSFEASASYGEETVEVEGTSTAPVEQPNPSMTVTSEVTSGPANGEYYEVGEEISGSVTVTNDGNVTLTDIDIVDPVTGEVWHIDELKPGESFTFESKHTVTEEDLVEFNETGEITLSFEASASYGDETVTTVGTSSAPLEQLNPSLSVSSEVTSEPKNGDFYEPGEKITYDIIVTNDGNVTLTNVVVYDELTGKTYVIDRLEPGETVTFSVEYVLTEDDAKKGSLTPTATVTADLPGSVDPMKLEIKIGEFKVAPKAPTAEPPYTGDDSNLMVWFTLQALSMLGIIMAIVIGRKHREEEKA